MKRTCRCPFLSSLFLLCIEFKKIKRIKTNDNEMIKERNVPRIQQKEKYYQLLNNLNASSV